MYLTNPLLPLNVSLPKATQDVKEALEKKEWHDIELGKHLLILVPYFLYNYHYYVEQSTSNNFVKETFDGVLVINGHKIKIEEDLRDLIKYNWKKGAQTTPKGEFEEKWNNIDKKQQNEVIKLKTAEYFDVPKSNVIITSVRKVLVPSYQFEIKVDGKDYELKVNAVDGKISGIKEVPIREKGMVEITKETISELKNPSSWVKYTKEMFTDAAKGVKSNSSSVKEKKTSQSHNFNIAFFARKEILLIIMLLALLLIYLTLFV